MGSILNWDNWSSLNQISNNQNQQDGVLDVSTSPVPTTLSNNGHVNVTMLELVKGLLEGQITTVQGELAKEGDERKENEARLTTCIKKLVDEVKKLTSKITLVEGRIEEIEKWRSSTPTPEQQRQLPPIAVVISSTGGRPSGNEITEALARFQIKMENRDDHIQASNSGAEPSEAVQQGSSQSLDKVRRPEGHQSDQVKVPSGFPATIPAATTSTSKIGNVGEHYAKVSKTGGSKVTHGLAPTPGRFLPVQCVCGLEFDSEASLLGHVGDQTSWKGVKKASKVSSLLVQNGNTGIHSKRQRTRKGMKHGRNASTPGFCLCGRDFRGNSRSFYSHIYYHQEDKRFLCKTCGARFAFSCHLRLHLNRSHKETSGMSSIRPGAILLPPTKSAVIGRKNERDNEITETSSTLNKKRLIGANKIARHGKVPSQPLLCTCGTKYRHEYSLYQHIKYFTKLKPKVFSRKAKPKKPGKVPFEEGSPPVRKKNIGKPASKHEHGIGKQDFTEDGRIRHFCKCGRSYNAKSVLKRHILGDSLEKQFECEVCPKRFHFHSQLKAHMITQHKMGYSSQGKIFACSKCAELFANMKLLCEHRREAH